MVEGVDGRKEQTLHCPQNKDSSDEVLADWHAPIHRLRCSHMAVVAALWRCQERTATRPAIQWAAHVGTVIVVKIRHF